jgi:hypothetical protein
MDPKYSSSSIASAFDLLTDRVEGARAAGTMEISEPP